MTGRAAIDPGSLDIGRLPGVRSDPMYRDQPKYRPEESPGDYLTRIRLPAADATHGANSRPLRTSRPRTRLRRIRSWRTQPPPGMRRLDMVMSESRHLICRDPGARFARDRHEIDTVRRSGRRRQSGRSRCAASGPRRSASWRTRRCAGRSEAAWRITPASTSRPSPTAPAADPPAHVCRGATLTNEVGIPTVTV